MKSSGQYSFREKFMTYGMVSVAFVVMQILVSTKSISYSLKGQLVPICAYVVLALSLNLTVGILGELSLGHAGFMGVGGFVAAIASVSLQTAVPFSPVRLLIAMVIGAIFAGVVGIIIGIPVLRLNGDYLAIVTLAFGEIIKTILGQLYVGMDKNGLHIRLLGKASELGMDPETSRMIVDGPQGISGIKPISSFTAGFILIVVALFVIYNLVDSRSGRAILALRDNRIAAESVGIPVTKYKMMAFVTSAALAGAAGALFSLNSTALVSTKFDFNTSILILVFVVLGGLGNMWGSIVAATVLTILPEMLRQFDSLRMLLYAIILIAAMLISNNKHIKNMIAIAKAKLKRRKAGESS